MRPAKGNEFWKRGLQFVIFYDIKDDFPVALFDSIREIIEYRELTYTKSNYDLVMVELYRALKRTDHYTEMLGRPMTVYLIDTDELEENKKESEEHTNEEIHPNPVHQEH